MEELEKLEKRIKILEYDLMKMDEEKEHYCDIHKCKLVKTNPNSNNNELLCPACFVEFNKIEYKIERVIKIDKKHIKLLRNNDEYFSLSVYPKGVAVVEAIMDILKEEVIKEYTMFTKIKDRKINVDPATKN